MAQINSKMGSAINTVSKEAKALPRGMFILGLGAAVTIFAPVIFVAFKRIQGCDYTESQNQKTKQAAIEEGELLLDAEVNK